MTLIPLGRRARIYISDSAFDADGLVPVRRCKDIKAGDEAKAMEAECRDVDYVISEPGAKTLVIEFDKLIEADDSGADVALLRNAYDNNTPLYVVVTRQPLDVASGKGVRFVAHVFGWPNEFPESDAAKVSLQLKQADPDVLPERIDTPYVTNVAPVVTCSGGATSFTEDSGAVTIDGSLTVTDGDSTTMTSATVEILNFQTGDVLAYSNASGVTGSWNSGTHKMTLTAGSPVSTATMRDRMRAVTFNNTSNTPNTTQRNLQFKVFDGAAWSAGSTKHVDVAAHNDPPTIITPDDAPTATVHVDTGVQAVCTMAATDPESDTVTFSITGGADAALFDLDGDDLVFIATSEDGNYTVIVTADDGHGGTDAITITVEVSTVAPEITSDGGGSTGSKTVSAGTGVTITTVTASGTAPIVFSLGEEHDESGFAIDPDTGEVTAATLAAGSYELELIATNGAGSDSQLLTVTASGGGTPSGYLRFVPTVTGDEQLASNESNPQTLTYQTADSGLEALFSGLTGHLTDPLAGDLLVLVDADDVVVAAHVKSVTAGAVATWLTSDTPLNTQFTESVSDVKPVKVDTSDLAVLEMEAYTEGEPPSSGAFQYAGGSIYIASDSGPIDAFLGTLEPAVIDPPFAGDVLRIIFTQEPQTGSDFTGIRHIGSIALAAGVWTITTDSEINFDTTVGNVATIFKQTW